MGKGKDEAALECYRNVLLKLWHVTGYIQWKDLPLRWIAANLPNVGVRLIHELMAHHVASGGRIDQTEETRPEYVAWRFHYDLRMPISNRRVYIETVLDQTDDLEDCTIWVVNIHDQ
ncbi:MAG TPA: hypothetical protein VH475_07785 [Tepidisphaeraceae bacterium]|jgi:hypothetical protein